MYCRRYIPRLSHLEIIHRDGCASRVPWSEVRSVGFPLHFTESARQHDPWLPARVCLWANRVSKASDRLRRRAIRHEFADGTLDRLWLRRTPPKLPAAIEAVCVCGRAAVNACVFAMLVFCVVKLPTLIFSGEPGGPFDWRLSSPEHRYLPFSINAVFWLANLLGAAFLALGWLICVGFVYGYISDAVRWIREIRRPPVETVGVRATSQGLYRHRADGRIEFHEWTQLEAIVLLSDFQFRGEGDVADRCVGCPGPGFHDWLALRDIVAERFLPPEPERRPAPPWIGAAFRAVSFSLLAGVAAVVHDLARIPGAIETSSVLIAFVGLAALALRLIVRPFRQSPSKRRNSRSRRRKREMEHLAGRRGIFDPAE